MIAIGPLGKPAIRAMADRWKSTIVARSAADDFTGGLVNGQQLAALDRKGDGPIGAFKVRGQVVYPVSCMILWLEENAERLTAMPEIEFRGRPRRTRRS